MNCYILGVISIFFHFKNIGGDIKNNYDLNSPNKSHEITREVNAVGSDLLFNINTSSKNLFLKKIDSTKLKTLKINAVKNKDSLKSKLNDFSAKFQAKEIVTYRIYFDGRIEKHIPKVIKKGNENKYKYVYHDKQGKKNDLGDYMIHKTQMYKGPKGKFVNLINLEEVPKYFKINNHQYHFNIDSPRSFVNEKTLASFLGAMFEVNYLDIGCNGFSHSDGSSKPSRSHINGNNGDFKYLRINKSLKCGTGTSLNIFSKPDSLDFARQNKWNDALYKFGWKSFLGWTYTSEGKKQYLNHIPKNTPNHFHHVHVQRYQPNFKEIRE